jgi:mono/diheme cytochrome c family protein
MKIFSIILVAMAMMMTTAAFAEDGAALYKAKCAGCHGAAGEGKSGPAIKGKANVSDVLTKGGLKGIHTKPMASLTPDQVSAIATFLK